MRRASLQCAISFLLVTVLLPFRVAAQSAYTALDAAERQIRAGTIFLQQGKYQEAIAHFEQAQALLGKPSAQTAAGIGLAELQMGHYEAARQMWNAELPLVTNNHARAQAHYMIGTAWLREAGDNTADKEKLLAAENSFREAVNFDPLYHMAFFNLGYALLRQNKLEESNAAFKDFISSAAENPESAKDLPLNPKILLAHFAIVDSKGRRLSSDSLRGRFVLFDFWATWCPPCIRALPALRQLAQFFPADQFELISVNEDVDSQTWQRFTQTHEVAWTQVWDENSSLYQAFALSPRSKLSLPRYVLVDADGFVRQVYSGTDDLGILAGQMVRIVRTAHPAKRPDTN